MPTHRGFVPDPVLPAGAKRRQHFMRLRLAAHVVSQRLPVRAPCTGKSCSSCHRRIAGDGWVASHGAAWCLEHMVIGGTP